MPSDWIPVGERLPDTCVSVPVLLDGNPRDWVRAYYWREYRGGRWVFPDDGPPVVARVTHWMPLPDPPEAEERR